MTLNLKHELPLPPFYSREKVDDWTWRPDWTRLFKDGLEWSKRFDLRPAAEDPFKIGLLLVDAMLTFCHPDFELYVRGRSGRGPLDDTLNISEFIYRNLARITCIFPTLDTHRSWQIFFASFLEDRNGNPPDPSKPFELSLEDVLSGNWNISPKAAKAINADVWELEEHLVHMLSELDQTGRLKMTIWPFHAMLGSAGYALMPHIQQSCFFHSIARSAQLRFQRKGEFELTENYSVLGPEVLKDAHGREIGWTSHKLLEELFDLDALVIAGEAKSHCVRWTVEDLVRVLHSRNERPAPKVYILEDCTSSVVVPGIIDFTDQTDAAFSRFEESGIHLVNSHTPVSEWPGIEEASAAYPEKLHTEESFSLHSCTT